MEPDPSKRWTIEDVMRDGWVKGIEVCTEGGEGNGRHVHVSARAMGAKNLAMLGQQ